MFVREKLPVNPNYLRAANLNCCLRFFYVLYVSYYYSPGLTRPTCSQSAHFSKTLKTKTKTT